MVCIIAVLVGFHTNSLNVFATDDIFTEEQAIRICESFVEDFNSIVKMGAEDQYIGMWAYSILTDWKDILDEIGAYYGVKRSTATVDSDRADVKIEAHGTKRIAVIEFELIYGEEPKVNIYSKFSLTKWLTDTGVGAVLLILNSIALCVFILVIKKPKSLPAAERNQAIDDTIAQIIRNEEMVDGEVIIVEEEAEVAKGEEGETAPVEKEEEKEEEKAEEIEEELKEEKED